LLKGERRANEKMDLEDPLSGECVENSPYVEFLRICGGDKEIGEKGVPDRQKSTERSVGTYRCNSPRRRLQSIERRKQGARCKRGSREMQLALVHVER
jgi:hypothetical protein